MACCRFTLPESPPPSNARMLSIERMRAVIWREMRSSSSFLKTVSIGHGWELLYITFPASLRMSVLTCMKAVCSGFGMLNPAICTNTLGVNIKHCASAFIQHTLRMPASKLPNNAGGSGGGDNCEGAVSAPVTCRVCDEERAALGIN